MSASTRSQLVSLVIIYLGVAYLMKFDTPFPVQLIFMFLCIAYSAWCFYTVFQGRDEVVSAGVKFALALASGIGVPLCITIVLVMSGVPSIQDLIVSLETHARSDLPTAAAGFGIGVTFAGAVFLSAFLAGLGIWRVSKR